MPIYTFRTKQDKREYTVEMTMAEREKFLVDNPDVEQILTTLTIGDPIKLGIRKQSSDMRQILQKVKNNHRGSTVNTGNFTEV